MPLRHASVRAIAPRKGQLRLNAPVSRRTRERPRIKNNSCSRRETGHVKRSVLGKVVSPKTSRTSTAPPTVRAAIRPCGVGERAQTIGPLIRVADIDRHAAPNLIDAVHYRSEGDPERELRASGGAPPADESQNTRAAASRVRCGISC